MEKADGVLLSSKRASMGTTEKHQLIQNIIAFERSLVSHDFDKIGSFCYDKYLIFSEDKVSTTGYPGFVVGPTTDRKFLEDGRNCILSGKGPCAYMHFIVYLSRWKL